MSTAKIGQIVLTRLDKVSRMVFINNTNRISGEGHEV